MTLQNCVPQRNKLNGVLIENMVMIFFFAELKKAKGSRMK